VSVVGFDDIKGAAFNNPSLTTIRQPLEEMGRTAARIALSRIQGKHEFEDEIAIKPELVTRESTCAPGRGMGAAQARELSKETGSGAGPRRPAARSGDEAG
jgi:hypothetical protein